MWTLILAVCQVLWLVLRPNLLQFPAYIQYRGWAFCFGWTGKPTYRAMPSPEVDLVGHGQKTKVGV